ncbi:GntR family transcriptional regulator [Kibdelosporangium phytohabitans]|uniref:GntR family transcriptional regulator n=1 Tax=Kibdelosporangium phytohabitans TaxID=860235 RepID=A0A0N9HVB1_9PSEU|nr:GntR family transcriptional regulator [Kibdelosporangium phytohabitans]ALG07481.1 GntR family transcriptional regulator [Kibdelosporangium phytohabitans]MBE1471607.1 DNA-binding transcriptional regulator YhcF (GntR family) [Kibdelosporangium phytohabitans]
MELTLDLDSDVPIYQQIRDRVLEAIAEGLLTEGDPLPSTRQLAADFGINFLTVSKAYDQLKQQGVIRINRKSGAVVRRDPNTGPPEPGFIDDWDSRMRVMLAEAAVQGFTRSDLVKRVKTLLDQYEGVHP